MDANGSTNQGTTKRCLKCQREFQFVDRKRDWFCDECRRLAARQGGIREVSTRFLNDYDRSGNRGY